MATESNGVTIFHDPQCVISRNTLGLIRNSGIEPTIIDYLRDPPGHDQLAELIRAAGLSVRAALREKVALYRELGLGDPTLTDAQLIDAMIARPILLARPF